MYRLKYFVYTYVIYVYYKIVNNNSDSSLPLSLNCKYFVDKIRSVIHSMVDWDQVKFRDTLP